MTDKSCTLTSDRELMRQHSRDLRDRQYRELKAANRRLYVRCLEYAEGVSLSYGLSTEAAAAVEAALVGLAWENFNG